MLDIAIGKGIIYCGLDFDLPLLKHLLNDSWPLIPGQRYDFIAHANQAVLGSAFWVQATNQLHCSQILNAGNIRGITYYDDGNTSELNIQPQLYSLTLVNAATKAPPT